VLQYRRTGSLPRTVEEWEEGSDVTQQVTFTKDMPIFEVLQADPRTREIFAIHGMGCIGCMGASMESIESGAKMHGIDYRLILDDLNRLPPLPDDQG